MPTEERAAKLAALIEAIANGDASGIAQGDVFRKFWMKSAATGS
jgi:hypothetical protein